VFARGELARTQAYLIEGELELQQEDQAWRLKAGDSEARYALAPGPRRSATAICLKPCQILFVDRELLDVMLTWSQTGGVEVREMNAGASETEGGDWMTALLQSKAFLRVPAGNIAQILSSMEPVSFEAGEVIIRQGDPGDYYYVIREGRAQVVLEDPGGHSEEELAQLGVGRAFGEEALVSGEPRNATVRALTRCHLMRLSSACFARLLKAPLLPEASLSELRADVQLLDVRAAGPAAANVRRAGRRSGILGLLRYRQAQRLGGVFAERAWLQCPLDQGWRACRTAQRDRLNPRPPTVLFPTTRIPPRRMRAGGAVS
jgi:CRP-like cAMP-binding protein